MEWIFFMCHSPTFGIPSKRYPRFSPQDRRDVAGEIPAQPEPAFRGRQLRYCSLKVLVSAEVGPHSSASLRKVGNDIPGSGFGEFLVDEGSGVRPGTYTFQEWNIIKSS